MPLAWTYEAGLPLEARIPGLWDNTVPVISGTCTNTVCSFLPQCGPEEPVSVPRCCTSTFCFTDKPKRPKYGSRPGTWLTGRDFEDQGHVYAITPQTKPADQSVIQGMFLLSHLWARILFDSSASHSFIVASCLRELGLEVEILENSLYASSPLGTKVSVELICRGCELEISGILLTVDLRVIDMLEFDFILGMEWLMEHRVIVEYDRRRVTAYT